MDSMAGFACGVDLLISEGMYGDDGMHDKMEEKGHMLFSDSARLAKESGAKLLWLTHYSTALTEPEQYLATMPVRSFLILLQHTMEFI